jgi:hypothetical protein
VTTWAVFSNVSGVCLNNLSIGAAAGSAACPAAIPANTLSANITLVEGPVPAGGGTVTNLEATNSSTASGDWLAEVIDNTTGTTLLSCTILNTSGTSPFCQNTGTASVAAGHYLQVKVTTNSGGNKNWRVTFRY